MIGSEFGFHNENDYNESDREMKDEKTVCIMMKGRR